MSWGNSEFLADTGLISTLFLEPFALLNTSATMRAVDRSRTAAILFCLFGYLFSKAATKTLQEHTATQGKKSVRGVLPEKAAR